MFYKECVCCSSQFIPPTWDYVLTSCSYVSVTRYQTCYRSRLNCHRRCCSGFQSSGGNCLRKSPWYSDALHSSVATYVCTYCIPLYMHVLLLLHTQTNASSGLLASKEQDPGYCLGPVFEDSRLPKGGLAQQLYAGNVKTNHYSGLSWRIHSKQLIAHTQTYIHFSCTAVLLASMLIYCIVCVVHSVCAKSSGSTYSSRV